MKMCFLNVNTFPQSEDYYMKRFIGCYNRSVILTYMSIVAAVIGIWQIAFHTDNSKLPFVMACLIIAGVCDMFDGKVARRCKRTEIEKDFGIQLDSLADTVSFVVFPIVVLIKTCTTGEFYIPLNSNVKIILVHAVSMAYIITGVTRLAWFNITTTGKTTYFSGLPVTSVAAIIPIAYLLFRNLPFFLEAMLIVYAVIAVLFVLNFKLKKPTGLVFVFFSIAATILITILFIK